jgi:zinc/manganese transport system ATP-binding protein
MGSCRSVNGTGINLRDVAVAYDRRPAVHHAEGRLEAESLAALAGPNRAGKPMLLKAITGVLKPSSGLVDWARLQNRDIGHLPQDAEIDRRFPFSVADTVQRYPRLVPRSSTVSDCPNRKPRRAIVAL